MKNLRSMIRLLFALVALAGMGPAMAASASWATQPDAVKAARVEAFRLTPGTKAARLIEMGGVDASEIAAIREANSARFDKRLQIGVGRLVPKQLAARSASLGWEGVSGGGVAAHWEISSAGAKALRIGLAASNLPPSAEIRFAGSGDLGTVYGPFSPAQILAGAALYWSPVLEGDRATVEVYVAAAASISEVALSVSEVSHLFVSPANPNAETLAKASQSCEVDLICRSATDAALANVGKAVARMTFSDGSGGGTFLCTGTLLNTTAGPVAPYFYSANHCMSTQASASTLTTHWFYDSTSCGSGVTSPAYVQVTGGATLLYANEASDVLFLRLNQNPPSGAIFAGWDSAALGVNVALTAVHHPAGDLKKVSLGSMGGFSAYGGGAGDDHIIALWNSTATGVTEGGSSGSGIFTAVGSPATEYRLRGGLRGGPSSCSASGVNLRDYYSRFDRVYPILAQFLSGTTTCTYALSPASAAVAAGGATGSFSVTATSGCSWTASSNANWISTSSSGTGSGTANYSVGPNTAGARTGTISVGGQTFTISQAAGSGGSVTSLISNGGFESGATSWVQQASGGAPIITADASLARSGSSLAWLGGYVSGTDSLYQDVTIPVGATQVTLQYWYRILTSETTSSIAYDTLAVAIQNPVTGAPIANVASYSNLNAASGWVQSPAFNLSAFAGQTIRLRFTAMNDFSNITSFYIDDVTLTTVTAGGTSGSNYTALWWNPAESGWGINFNHQGSILFGTLFTYDASGQPLWLVMSAGALQPDGVTFTGALYRTTGPPFNAVPFTPIGAANVTQVGTMTVTFAGASTGTLNYTFNGAPVTKSIQKQVYGTRAANCVPTSASRTSLTNYQDLWWNPGESGWGVNLTHQDSTLFATLFTYDTTGAGLWLVMSSGTRQPDGSYLGNLYRTTGPAFNAVPFTPIGAANLILVGTMRFTFTSGTTAVMTYSVNGVNVTKSIQRQEFSSPLPACS